MNYVLSEEEYERLKLFGNAASQKRIEAYNKQVGDAACAMLQGVLDILMPRGFQGSPDPFFVERVKAVFDKFQESTKPLPNDTRT